MRGRLPLPASPPNSPSAMGMAPSPAAPGARPSPFCGWGGSGAEAPGRAKGRVAGLCWSRGSGGGVLWKESEELLRLGQPECGSSEDVDRELSKPRLFFPGGLLLMLRESLLPANRGETGAAGEPAQAKGRNSSP